MYSVTIILPKDKTVLEEKYAKVLAEVVAKQLTYDELGYLIQELKKRENSNWRLDLELSHLLFFHR